MRNIVPHNAECPVPLSLLLLRRERRLRANTDADDFPDRHANPDNHADRWQSDTNSQRNTNGVGHAHCFRNADGKCDSHSECDTHPKHDTRRSHADTDSSTSHRRATAEHFHASVRTDGQRCFDWRLRH